jgi:mRNA interferase MazF
VTGRPPIQRGDIVLSEAPFIGGRAIQKRRPFVVVSPNEINLDEFTYLVAPLTTGARPYRFRVPCDFAGKQGHVILDQVFTLNAQDAGARIGKLKPQALSAVLEGLREMFEE